MTLASSVITAALRESNLISAAATPTTTEQTEILARLNAILFAAMGFDVGDDLRECNIGGQYDQSAACQLCVPANLRLVLSLSGAMSFNLDPQPYDGQRLAVVDATGTLATNNLTLNGNGRFIEGSASLVLNVNNTSRQWFYRADLGNWIKIADLALGDSLPFPEEFDDYFITLLAMRINPRYGQQLPAETGVWMKRMASQLGGRYRRPRPGNDSTGWALSAQRQSGMQPFAMPYFNSGGFWPWP